MAITFDGTNKLIVLTVATTFSANDIYSDAKRWEDDNMTIVSPMEADGKASLGGGVYTDIIYTIQNGWQLKADNYAQGTLITINGTFISDDGSSRVAASDAGEEVVWQFSGVTAGTIVVSGSGVTAQDKEDIAGMVWEETVADHTTPGTLAVALGELLKHSKNRWKIDNNQLTIYDDDAVTPMYVFDLKDASGNPTESSPFERVPAP